MTGLSAASVPHGQLGPVGYTLACDPFLERETLT